MTKPGKITAMISSTSLDLPDHRKAAKEACEKLGVFPLVMENLPARDADAIRVSMDMVDQADVYIGVFAWRYGHRPEGHTISITEMEYNRAVERKIPILIFIIHQDHPITISMVETEGDAQAKLATLKETASEERGRSEFKSAEELHGKVLHSLTDFIELFEAEHSTDPPTVAPSTIPKAFISYSTSDRTLAMRIKRKLSDFGCDSWQFDLSAVPGTDAWDTILKQIEESDFFIVLLSQSACASRGVREEIAHAHYCALNNAVTKPRIVPVMLDRSVVVPRQIVRAVRLHLDVSDFDTGFGSLLQCMGLYESPFSYGQDLFVSTVANREYDVPHEAAMFAKYLIAKHAATSQKFQELTGEWKESAGGRFRVSDPQTLVWHQDSSRHEFDDGERGRCVTTDVLVFFSLASGTSSGSWSTVQIVVRLQASELLRFKHSDSGIELDSNTFTLNFIELTSVSEDQLQSLCRSPVKLGD